MAAKRRYTISKVSSQSIVFAENVLWLEFCDCFLCELIIYSQLFGLQRCLLEAHNLFFIPRLGRFAGTPQAALDPTGLPQEPPGTSPDPPRPPPGSPRTPPDCIAKIALQRLHCKDCKDCMAKMLKICLGSRAGIISFSPNRACSMGFSRTKPSSQDLEKLALGETLRSGRPPHLLLLAAAAPARATAATVPNPTASRST